MRILIVVLASLIATSCGAPAGTAPLPSVTASPTAAANSSTSPRSSASPSPFISPSTASQLVLTDVTMLAAAGPMFLFQVIGDDRLRAVTWDGTRNGVVGARVSVPWSQSLDGSRYAAGGVVYEANGRAVGAVPPGLGESFSWARDGSVLCAAVPITRQNGATMTLVTAVPGGPVHVVASGFTAFGDNAGYPVLACDPKTDRAIVGQFGQGLYAGRVFVFSLSTGELIRSADLGRGAPSSWLAASTDGSLIAESSRTTMTGAATTVVRHADDGAALATIEGLEARGFSGDGKMLYGLAGDGRRRLEVREWKTQRIVWVADGYQYNAFHAEPAGSIVAVPTGFDAPLTEVQLYLVLPDGTAKMLPHVNGRLGF